MTKELEYMAEVKSEILQRFHESAFYHERAGKADVHRYTDKFRTGTIAGVASSSAQKTDFEPYWSRLPAELDWRKDAKRWDNREESVL